MITQFGIGFVALGQVALGIAAAGQLAAGLLTGMGQLVIGFTETLCQELQDSDVGVSCVVPGGIKTNIHRNALFCKQANPSWSHEDCVKWFEEAALTSSRKAAQTILQGIRKNKSRILIGADAHVMDCMKRLFPVHSSSSYIARKMNTLEIGRDELLMKVLARLFSSEKSLGSSG